MATSPILSDPLMPSQWRPRTMRFALVGSVVFACACSIEKQNAPNLAGPSEFGLAVTLTAVPDRLPRDGSSQSLITVSARDWSGRSVAGQLLSLGVSPYGAAPLSAGEVRTDGAGIATFLLTAPAAGSVLPGNEVLVLVTPGGGNFANVSPRTLAVGITGAPNTTPPSPAFTVNPPNPQARQMVTFDASSTRDEGVPCGDACTYEWNFDDGSRAVGRQVTHVFTVGRPHSVALTVVDAAGASGVLREVVHVTAVPAPAVAMTVAPSAPVAGQIATLTAIATTAPGHSIQSYLWDFGDGTNRTTSTPTVSKSYGLPGVYTAAVTAIDDLEQAGTTSLQFTVTAGIAAAFAISPHDPRANELVTFNASASTSANGSAIVRYVWDFGDASPMTTISSPSVTHRFGAARTYVVQLTITDSQGRSAMARQELRIAP